jgi:hypothetical protein
LHCLATTYMLGHISFIGESRVSCRSRSIMIRSLDGKWWFDWAWWFIVAAFFFVHRLWRTHFLCVLLLRWSDEMWAFCMALTFSFLILSSFTWCMLMIRMKWIALFWNVLNLC